METQSSPSTPPDQKEESIFSGEEFSMEGYDKHIRQARNAIYTAAAVLFINLLVLAATAPNGYEYLWIDLGVWGIFIAGFIALALYTKKKPYTAIVGAMILYALYILLNALLDVSTLYKGIIMKIIIIVLLVKGVNNAKQAQSMKEQFQK